MVYVGKVGQQVVAFVFFVWPLTGVTLLAYCIKVFTILTFESLVTVMITVINSFSKACMNYLMFVMCSNSLDTRTGACDFSFSQWASFIVRTCKGSIVIFLLVNFPCAQDRHLTWIKCKWHITDWPYAFVDSNVGSLYFFLIVSQALGFCFSLRQ